MCLPLTEANVDRFRSSQAQRPDQANEAVAESQDHRLSPLGTRLVIWLVLLALGLAMIYLVDLHAMPGA